MQTLQEFLLNKGFIKVKLKANKSNHFQLKATINGVSGLFILDTGASNSCIDILAIDNFNLEAKSSDIKAAGANAGEMETLLSKNNSLKIGRWKKDKIKLVLFNMIHVNTALKSRDANPIDGIIGADILKKAKAVIDYEKKYLYLQS